MNKKYYLTLIAILSSHLFVLIKTKFTAWPEMLLWPYLMIKGWLPYKDIAIAHNPLMLLELSFFYKIFGVGVNQLKIFTWIVILTFNLLIFIVTKRIWNKKIALFSVIFYSIWMFFYEGNGLWFDLYMGILAFSSFCFALRKNWFLTGFFWALAFLSKQTAFWFLIPISYTAITERETFKSLKDKILKFTYGSIVVFVVFLIFIYSADIMPDFFNWAVKFGIFTLPKLKGQIQFPDFKNIIVSFFPFIIFLYMFFNTLSRQKYKKSNIVNLFLWSFAGVLGTFPRFELFHFQPAVPYLAIATSIAISNLNFRTFSYRLFLIFYFSTSFYLVFSSLHRNYGKETRFYDREVLKVVEYIKNNTIYDEKIFVLNWWDSIYALTNTMPASRPWVPQLAWYQELPGIEEKEVNSIEKNKPKLILLYPYTDFGLSSFVPQKLYHYVQENYKLKDKVGNLEVLEPK